jgi:hypothetical protein
LFSDAQGPADLGDGLARAAGDFGFTQFTRICSTV